MQNFTLGKKGFFMLFFAFILLIGNSPTYAQSENCPTVSNTDPDEFCYLSTIADLTNETGAQGNGDELRWYRTQTSTNPIPNDELLTNGSYWAGNLSNTCREGRTEVTVTVDDFGAPTTQFGNTFAPCEYDEADQSTVQDLIDNVDGNEVEIFAAEFGETAMESTTRLVEGNSYFAGQRNPDTDCRTSRIALRYDPVEAFAPTGEPTQQFCVGATVADLEAEATSPDTQAFRWYSTATSSPALSSTTPLVDGETYFATQIVNRSNSNLPPCESEDRFAVIVELIEAEVGEPQVGIVCTTEVEETFPSVDAVENFLRDLLDPSAPTGGTFNPTAAELIEEYQNTPEPQTGDFTTTYSAGEEGCEYTVELTIRIIESQDANAGTIEDIIVECEDDSIVILDDSLLSQDATRGGTFTGEGVNEDGNFDPAIGPGDYTITYSVNDEQDCVNEGTEDETTFTITVQGTEEFGDPIVLEMCIIEVQELIETPADAEAFFNNILSENGITNFDGTFNPSEDVVGTAIFAYINSEPTEPETFNTTYTVTNNCGEESVDITLTINNTEEPNAGEINPAPVCASATPFDLFSLLGEDNDAGGTFSDDNGLIENGQFDVSEMGTYDITYTVTESTENCTAGEPDSTEFTLTVNEGTVAESPEAAIVCETDVEATFPSVDEIRKFYIAIAQQAGFPTNGTISPNGAEIAADYQGRTDKIGDYNTTYTFGEGDCQTSVVLTVSIVPSEEANAGTIEDVTVDCDEDAVIDLASLPNEGGNTGGTFTGEGVNEEGNFDPSVGPGTYTITYTVDDTADCVIEGTSDETTFTITVQGTDQLPEAIAMEMCITEVQALLADFPRAEAFFENILVENGITNLDGSFDESAEDTGLEILSFITSNPTAPETFGPVFYTVTSDCGEETVAITLTINNTEEPNAGDINPAPVCASATPFDLFSLLGEDNDAGGTFSDNNGVIEDGMFDVSVVDSYDITYTVTESNDNCTAGEPDSTEFTLNVNEGTVAESPEAAIVCEGDVQDLFPSNDEIRKYYTAIAQQAGFPTNGTFDPTPREIAEIYQNDEDGLGDFTTTYSFGDGECQNTVDLTVTIVPNQDANAGTIADINVDCASEDAIVLDDSLLSDDANTGGTFTGEGVNDDGNFDPAIGPGTYEITYTVDDSANCVNEGTSAFTTFNIIISGSGSVIDSPAPAIVCEDDVQTTFPGVDALRDFYLELSGLSEGGTFEPTLAEIAEDIESEGLGNFTTTYTVGDGECPTSIELTVSIVPNQDANAGTITNINIDCASEDIVILDDTLLSDDANTGGTFTGEGINEEGNFDPAIGPGTYVITYSVDGSANCVNEGTSDSTTFNITVSDEANAGGGATLSYCITEIEDMSEAEAVAIFNDLLPADTDEGGNFSPTIETLIAQFLSNPIGTFTTTYTVSNGDCEDSADYTVIINDTEVANAGPATTLTFCSTEGEIDLTDYLSSEANPNGIFEGLEGNMFDPSEAGVDTYTFTYTVDSTTACVTGEDSATYTVEVIEGVNAGSDNSIEVCLSEVDNFSEGQVRNLFLDLLDPGVSEAGTFSPTIAEIIADYNDGSKLGDYTTTYTLSEGECTASVDLTVTVLASPDAPQADAEQFFCSANNPTIGDLTVTGEDAVWFTDAELTTQADTTDPLVDGQVYYAAAISDNGCESAAASVTVTIDDSEDAPVADAEQTFCSEDNPTVADLDITGNDVIVYEDAELTIVANSTDPLVDGDYYATTACAEDATMITVTVTETPALPVADAEQSFCIVDAPTVGDIQITGDDIIWYSDADLTTVIPETSELTNAVTYYAISSVGEGACESSGSVSVTVTLNTAVSPTIQPEGNEFCRNDEPTVQDLIGNLNGDGIRIYDSAVGGTPIDASTELENGVTYYATATDSTTGCESDERRAVNVEVGFCGIPDAFSPNGDNINDRFVIPDIAEDYPNYTIEIFNRWGNAVFKGNANTPDWDGTSNQSATLGDNVLPAGVYFYIVNYNDGQTTPVQGKLYLSR